MIQIERIGVEALIPYARNSRTHSDAQVAQIAASIREFGFTNPVLVDEANGIIAGHGRVLAARKLKMQDVPAIRLSHLTEAQKRAYVIADNKLALNAGWDIELLRLEINDLGDMGFDLELTGFDQDELDELLALGEATPEGHTDPDAVPEPPAQAITVPGDIWQLGKHRLMCGDSTDAAMVAVLMDGKKADLCLTDPPYGLGADGKESGKNNYDVYVDSESNLIDLANKWLPIARSISNAVVFSPGVTNAWKYPKADWIMCWFYGGGQLRSSWGFNCWQPFLCYGKDPSLASGNGGRPDAVDMNTPSNSGDINHPCPKPVKLWEWFIHRLSFKTGAVMYEPFSGSGTTLIAAEKTGRRCYAMELSPQYVDVAVKRWQEFTGQVATLEGDGRSFADMATERCKADA